MKKIYIYHVDALLDFVTVSVIKFARIFQTDLHYGFYPFHVALPITEKLDISKSVLTKFIVSVYLQ